MDGEGRGNYPPRFVFFVAVGGVEVLKSPGSLYFRGWFNWRCWLVEWRLGPDFEGGYGTGVVLEQPPWARLDVRCDVRR
jgi:hypothetical protein